MKRLLLLLFLPIYLSAHPHVFIKTELNFIVKKEKISKLNVSWTFDDMSSEIFMMDYDKNRDKKLNKKEIQKFKKTWFDKLSKKDYFTHLKVDGKKIDISAYIKNFTLDYKKNFFIVKFTIDFKKIKQKKSLSLAFWEEEYYNSFSIEDLTYKGKELKTIIDLFFGDLFVTDIVEITL